MGESLKKITFRAQFLILIALFSFAVILTEQTSVSAATYVVTKTADTSDGTCDSDCSLREAIVAANANTGADEVDFAIPISDPNYVSEGSYFPITTTSTLSLTDTAGVFINGYSQSGAMRNTSVFGATLNTVIKIYVYCDSTSQGVISIGGNNNHISGLVLTGLRASNQILFTNSDNNWFEGNYIGSNVSGTATSGGGDIMIYSTSDNNFIGTNGDGIGDPGERNLHMGSTASISDVYADIAGNNNVVAGNYMGTDKTTRVCTNAVVVGAIINIGGLSTGTRIGTNYDSVSDSEEGNIIGCVNSNQRALVRLGIGGGIAGGTSNALVQGNYIGTNMYGDNLASLLGNRPVIVFRDSQSINNIIKGNVIANAPSSNGIQTLVTSPLSYGNTFSQNSVYSNFTLGIGINGGNAVPLVNDAGDADTGTNDLMNYPIITKAGLSSNNKLMVRVNLDFAAAEAPYTIEFFDNDILDGTGNGEGKYYIGAATTSSTGNDIILTVPLTGYVPTAISKITATATNGRGSTSEFSAATLDTTVYTTLHSVNVSAPESSASRSIELSIEAVSEFNAVSQMKISNQSDLADADWIAYASTKSWDLTSGDGNKTVYVKFMDSAGNESLIYTCNVLLDTESPTGTITIEDNAISTANSHVVLSLNATDSLSSVTEMMVSENNSFAGGSWETYETINNFELTSNNGIKTVYVKFRDNVGNVSNVYSDSIVLDSEGPMGTMSINGGATFTNQPLVNLSFTASDALSDIGEMLISENDVFTGATWVPYATTGTLELSPGDTIKTVYVKFRDALENEGPTLTSTITLDTTSPRAAIITNLGLIPNLPDKSFLFYYFTSQVPQIKGVAEPRSTVFFKSLLDGHVYSTTTNMLGKFTIVLKEPMLSRGQVDLQYYAQDLAGNKSQMRKLHLVIGEENFPAEEHPIVEETPIETQTPSPTVTDTVTPEPTGSVTVSVSPTMSEIPTVTTSKPKGILSVVGQFLGTIWKLFMELFKKD